MRSPNTLDKLNASAANSKSPNRRVDSEEWPTILAFEMQDGGHHPSYIRNIARLWHEHEIPATIEFLVTPKFAVRHRDVFEAVATVCPSRVRIRSLTDEEHKWIESSGKLREFRGWKTFCKYATELNAVHGLLMYADHFQLPMLLGQSSPCPFSAIYFRPTFHYGQWAEHQNSFKQKLAAVRKKVLLKQCLKTKQFKYLFCLDEFAPTYIDEHFGSHVETLCFPDSFVRYDTTQEAVDQLRAELQVEPNRRVLLLLGIMDYRKGPVQLLDAAKGLTPECQQDLCLMLIGKIDPSIEAEVLERVAELRGSTPIQIVMKNEYVSDTFVQHYYELADVALTTYQRHMGMSSALMRAGIAKVPVLSSGYGLMGELVRRHRLGITTDTSDPKQFTQGLEKALTMDIGDLFDQEKAIDFADQHSPEALGNALQNWVQKLSQQISK